LPSLELEDEAAATVPGSAELAQEQTHKRHAESRHKAAIRLTQGIKGNYLSGNLDPDDTGCLPEWQLLFSLFAAVVTGGSYARVRSGGSGANPMLLRRRR
jgi:hypothetical protein